MGGVRRKLFAYFLVSKIDLFQKKVKLAYVCSKHSSASKKYQKVMVAETKIITSKSDLFIIAASGNNK